MSQGQVPRVLRKGAKIVAATKSPPPQTSACLSHGGGVERGALCPVSLCGMGHPGGLHSSLPRLGACCETSAILRQRGGVPWLAVGEGSAGGGGLNRSRLT